MMKLIVVGVVVALATAVRAAPPPTIEDAIAHAAPLGKPVVAEFSATWCGPCRLFETEVLHDPRVVRALADVEFVRYDIDSSPGDDAARRYGVGGVPTILIIELDGHASVRKVGLGAERGRLVPWFLGLLDGATAQRTTVAELEAAIAKRPADLTLRTRLADHYRAVGKPEDAIATYQQIADQPGIDRGVAAAAREAIDDLELAVARTQLTVSAAIEFAGQFPASPLTTRRLAIALASRRVTRDVLDPLIRAHVDGVVVKGRAEAIRLALLAGLTGVAEVALTLWQHQHPESAEARLVGVELALHTAAAGARHGFDQVCTRPAIEIELECYTLRTARNGQHPVPGIERLRTYGNRVLADLGAPGATSSELGLEALTSDADRPFGNAIAHAFRDAGMRCGELARVGTAGVALRLPPTAGRPTDVIIQSASKTLDDCLRDALIGTMLPAPPIHLGGVFYARLIAEQPEGRVVRRRRMTFTLEPSSSVASGALMFAFDRGGALGAQGLGTRGMIDVAPLLDLRFVAAWQVEYGVARDESRTYVARALGGVGIVVGHDGSLTGVVGFGVSRFGDAAPRAAEVPVELHLRVPIHDVVGHVWFGTTYRLGAPVADGLGSDTLIGDEFVLGLAASVSVRGAHVFLGGAYEQRAAGSSGLVLVGVPLGSFF